MSRNLRAVPTVPGDSGESLDFTQPSAPVAPLQPVSSRAAASKQKIPRLKAVAAAGPGELDPSRRLRLWPLVALALAGLTMWMQQQPASETPAIQPALTNQQKAAPSTALRDQAPAPKAVPRPDVSRKSAESTTSSTARPPAETSGGTRLPAEFEQALERYAAKPGSKAIALALDANGRFAYGIIAAHSTQADANAEALEECARYRSQSSIGGACRLYAAGEKIVW